MCPVQLWAAPRARLAASVPSGAVTVMVRECVSSHSPDHGTVGDVGRVAVGDRSGAGRHPHRITHRVGVLDQVVGEFCRRPSVRQGGLDGRLETTSLAGAQRPRFGDSSRCAPRHRLVRMGIQLMDSRGPAVGPPEGPTLDTDPVPQWDGGRFAAGPGGPGSDGGSQIGTGGSRIGTVRKMWCQGVIQVVASRALRPGVVELGWRLMKPTRFQVSQARRTVLLPALDSAIRVRIEG